MAVTRGGTVTTWSTSGTTSSVSQSHTVDADTTLLILVISAEAQETMDTEPVWNSSEAMTLIHASTAGTSGDVRNWIYGLVNPTATTANITYTVSSNDNGHFTAINYKGTVTDSVAAATTYIDEDVDNAGTTDNYSISYSTTANCLLTAGVFRGGDGDPASNNQGFAELADSGTGTSSTSDISFYVADSLSGDTAGTITVTWSATDENAGQLIEIIEDNPNVNVSATTDTLTITEYNAGVDPGLPGNDFSGDSDCKLWMQFESGALTTDSSGNHSAGVFVEDGTVDENTGNYKQGACSADFLTSNGAFSIADSDLVSGFPFKNGGGTTGTFMWWMYWDDQTDNGYAMKKGLNGDLIVSCKSSGYIQIYNDGWGSSFTSSSMVTGRWYHCMLSIDSGTSANLRIWDDTAGAFIDDIRAEAVTVGANTDDFIISDYNDESQWFRGDLDEFLVFNTVRSMRDQDAIIANEYPRTLQNDYDGDTGLCAWWQFEPGALTTDSSGNGNTLTLGGSAMNSETYDYWWGTGGVRPSANSWYYESDGSFSSGFPLADGEGTTFTWLVTFKYDTISAKQVLIWHGPDSWPPDATLAIEYNSGNNIIAFGDTADYFFDTGSLGTPVYTEAGVWYTVMVTHSSGSYTFRLYDHDADAEIVNTSGSGASFSTSTEDFRISDYDYELEGVFSDIAVWNVVKTEEDWDKIVAGTYTTATEAVEVNATTDALSLTEYAADVNAETNVEATTDTLSITEYASTVSLDIEVGASTDSLSLTEYASNVNAEINVETQPDALSLTEYTADVNAETNVEATTDTLSITEYQSTVSLDVSVDATTDSLSLTEYAADVNAEVNVEATTDSLSLTEYAAGVNAETNIEATTDTLSLTEYAAGVNAEINVEATADSLSLTEYAADVNAETNIEATTDSLSLTEYAAGVNAETNVEATTDSLSLTEYAANVNAEINVEATTDTLTLTEYGAQLGTDVDVNTITDSLSLTEYAATVNAEINVPATLAQLTLAVHNATVDVSADTNIVTNVAALTLVEYGATVLVSKATTEAGGVAVTDWAYVTDGRKKQIIQEDEDIIAFVVNVVTSGILNQ
jgi:hypothetical protein